MSHALDREIRSILAGALSRETGALFDAGSVHLPSRHSAASVHIPYRLAVREFSADIFPSAFGAPFVSSCRTVGGWLLVDFFDAFYDMLVERVRASLPAASGATVNHAVNKLQSLARHGGTGCPRVPSLQRALLLALAAQKSPGAYAQACCACETMLHAVPPRDRPALADRCGALADALARLLSSGGQMIPLNDTKV
jgi:hypothetical protein